MKKKVMIIQPWKGITISEFQALRIDAIEFLREEGYIVINENYIPDIFQSKTSALKAFADSVEQISSCDAVCGKWENDSECNLLYNVAINYGVNVLFARNTPRPGEKETIIKLYHGDELIGSIIPPFGKMELKRGVKKYPLTLFGFGPDKKDSVDYIEIIKWVESRACPSERIGIEKILDSLRFEKYDGFAIARENKARTFYDEFRLEVE